MFREYCSGCKTNSECFEKGECLRQKIEELFPDDLVVDAETDFTEEEILQHRVLMSDAHLLKHGSNT